MSYRYEILSPEQALAFDAMVLPACRKALGEGSVAAGAWFRGEPAGLALCGPGRAPAEAELLSLFVAPLHRLGGVGASLLALAETFLLAGGMDAIHTTWTRAEPGAPAFERVLEKRGWSAPKERVLLLRDRLDGPFGRQLRARLKRLRSARALPRGYAAAPWTGLTPDERAFIRSRAGLPGWHSPEAAPLREESALAPELSAVLRRGDEIAGWATVHRLSRDTVRMTDVFVRHGLGQATSVGAALMVHTIGRILRAGVPVLTWGIGLDEGPLLDLCQNRLGDIAELNWSMEADKPLSL